jgi:hypothetical protein
MLYISHEQRITETASAAISFFIISSPAPFLSEPGTC